MYFVAEYEYRSCDSTVAHVHKDLHEAIYHDKEAVETLITIINEYGIYVAEKWLKRKFEKGEIIRAPIVHFESDCEDRFPCTVCRYRVASFVPFALIVSGFSRTIKEGSYEFMEVIESEPDTVDDDVREKLEEIKRKWTVQPPQCCKKKVKLYTAWVETGYESLPEYSEDRKVVKVIGVNGKKPWYRVPIVDYKSDYYRTKYTELFVSREPFTVVVHVEWKMKDYECDEEIDYCWEVERTFSYHEHIEAEETVMDADLAEILLNQ